MFQPIVWHCKNACLHISSFLNGNLSNLAQFHKRKREEIIIDTKIQTDFCPLTVLSLDQTKHAENHTR